MKNGKLSEGVYKLTVSSTGRTLVRAKMVKAIAKKVQEAMQQEEKAPVRWYSGAELLAEYGIPTSRLYNHRDTIQQYISKPDGIHYRYHEAMLSDAAVMDLLTRPVRYRNTNKRAVAAAVLARLKANAAATQQVGEHPVTTETAPNAQSWSRRARKIRCLETNVVFDSVTDGAGAIGAAVGDICRSIRKGYACRGFHFEYA